MKEGVTIFSSFFDYFTAMIDSDGYEIWNTANNNFVYYTIAGFSEYDNFRSNQIREGLISREEALKLCEEDNRTRYDTLKNFSDIIGFNLDDVLSKISCLPKLY